MERIKNKPKTVRFLSVGLFNTLLDIGLLLLLSQLGLIVIAANIISSTTAFCVSFVMNKKITFQTNGTDIRREIILFVLVTLFGLWVIQSLVIASIYPPLIILLELENTALLVAKLIATGITLVWNYILYNYVVFRHSETPIERSRPRDE